MNNELCSVLVLQITTATSRTPLRPPSGRDVGVGVFPEGEEVLIGRLSFGGVAVHGVGSTELQMR
jgi:hypothetical protein